MPKSKPPPPPEAPQQDPRAPRLAAVLFDADLSGHRVDLEEHVGPVGEQSLLWIDAQLDRDEDKPLPEALRRFGADMQYLCPEMPEGTGVVNADNDWTYLYADALNSPTGKRFSSEALVVAIGPGVVITAHRRPIDFLSRMLDNDAAHMRVGGLQPGSFAASILDRMLTDYLDARDEFESQVDRIEQMVLRRPQNRHLTELQQLRRQASRLRKFLAMQRDMFDALARPDFHNGQHDEVARHWQLLSARYARTIAAAEAARDMVNGSFDVYASRVAHGTNETMRTLTVVTVVLGTLAFVAGVMGMNFEADLFETGSRGFWWTVGGMGTFAVLSIAAAIGWRAWRSR